MERLGHMIHNAVDSGLWAPFLFIRNGTPLLHLFFTDDLILYVKADLAQADVIASILAEYGKYSSHRSVGNGRAIDILRDVWVPSLGPLSRFSLDPALASRNLTFANLTTVDGNWDVMSLFALFDTQAIPHILSIKCPSLEDGNDQSRNLWLQILPGALLRPFFECDLQQWLSCNLTTTILNPQSSLPWNLVFASLTWQIWKRRNDLIFQNPDLLNDATIVRRSLAWVKHYSDCVARGTGSASGSQSEPLERVVSCLDWVILNVDGAVPMPMSNGSIGGLFRNCGGDWIMGFAKAVGHVNSLQAELWALFEGLSLAWKQGFEKVLVRSDSKQAVDFVNSPSADSSVLSLVRAIHRLRR
ncbi:hypothetical protein V6N11_069627 [Hibiscus sabdariffa]|uniref:RNase H type-1 domain-containing protein n=1 Tax=Hibiscus sabdariffa TaxID=183260 RepID=A0ABR2Q3B4_9ROSI